MKRYSKKREAILECMRTTVEHPAAEWVYNQLKPNYPDLSLATVYRNLLQLKEAGLVISMGTVQGQERFDADIHPHSHAVCTSCGRIDDIFEIPVPDKVIGEAEQRTGFDVSYAGLQFFGVCAECQKKNKEMHNE